MVFLPRKHKPVQPQGKTFNRFQQGVMVSVIKIVKVIALISWGYHPNCHKCSGSLTAVKATLRSTCWQCCDHNRRPQCCLFLDSSGFRKPPVLLGLCLPPSSLSLCQFLSFLFNSPLSVFSLALRFRPYLIQQNVPIKRPSDLNYVEMQFPASTVTLTGFRD